MRTTIDKAGRLVIPAALREQLGLKPGTELEIVVDDLSLRLERAVPGPRLARRGGRLVIEPQVPEHELPDIDVGALIEEERSRWPV